MSHKSRHHAEQPAVREHGLDMKVAVVAHTGKSLGGGLNELRTVLCDRGIKDPMWSEVPKSRKAPERVREAIDRGARIVLVWGGDGMVQQCVAELAGTDVAMGILPAGTANLLAANLGIPQNIPEAVEIALNGVRTALDVGTMNGECFAVMGGAGFDGAMINDVDGAAKERLGRLAYVRSSLKAMYGPRPSAKISIDGQPWFEGPASCVLVGNVGTVIGGLKVFEIASPTDGRLDVGVINAEGALQWLRVFGRVVGRGDVDRSRLVQSTQAKKIDVEFSEKLRYEVDGGARTKTRRLKIRIKPRSLIVCTPREKPATPASIDEQTIDVEKLKVLV